MRSGFFVPNLGPFANVDNVALVARGAEELGFDSVWVTDRLLMPTNPSVPFRGSPDGAYPEVYRSVLDPLSVLAFLAAVTSRLRLGTSILNISYHHPVVVGRALTTIDVLSQGRLVLGAGVGWHPDEFAAVGADMRTRGRRADEFLRLLTAIWTENPVSFEGDFFKLRESSILPKPVQRPHPPILLAVNSEAALRRAARLDCGIHPVNPDPAELHELAATYRRMLRDAGRDSASAEIVVRAEIAVSDSPLPDPRPAFHGTLEQISQDVDAMRRAGATEVIFDPSYFVESISAFTEHMGALADMRAHAQA